MPTEHAPPVLGWTVVPRPQGFLCGEQMRGRTVHAWDRLRNIRWLQGHSLLDAVAITIRPGLSGAGHSSLYQAYQQQSTACENRCIPSKWRQNQGQVPE